MASLLSMGMPTPRGTGIYEDTLLGIEPTVGMTDRGFQQMGRAPVDELFAGRNSAWIDDAKWDELELQARDALTRARVNRNKDNRPNYTTRFAENMQAQNQAGRALAQHELPHNSNTSYLDDTEGGDDDRAIRKAVSEATGLYMYPGQGVKGNVGDSIFMYEFDDSGATLKEGWRDGKSPSLLGDILQHEELYNHYPELRNLPLSVEALGPRLMGSYGGIDSDHGLGRMRLNSSMGDKDIMDTILHETQHYIQRLENWPGGGGHNDTTSRNFAGWHPGRTEQWGQVAKDNQGDLESVRDQFAQEAYENITGEILARDVEQRFNTRNSLNAVIDDYNNPNGEFHELPKEQQDELTRRATYTANQLNQYPAHPRDAGNSYPHNMPETNPMTNPYVMANAMNERIYNHGYGDDEDTLNAYANADSLFEEAYRAMQKKKNR